MLNYLEGSKKKSPFWRFFNKKPRNVSESGGERRKIRPFDRQRRVFLTKFRGFGISLHENWPVLDFFIQWKCKNSGAVRKHTQKNRAVIVRWATNLFSIWRYYYKIFNFEQSIVHILRTYLTTGLDKGRAWEYWQSDLGVQGAGLQTASIL